MKKGFTMIELIAIIIILSVISLIAFTSYSTIIKNTEISTEKDIVRNIVIEANMLYNDYALKNKQDQIINTNIYDLITTENKPVGGTLIINEYGNVAALVRIDDRCYRKVYDSNQVNLVDADNCTLDYNDIDKNPPTINLEVVGTRYNEWYKDDTYVKITVEDIVSGVKNYKWCLGIDCVPITLETANRVVEIEDTTGTQVCVIAVDNANYTTDKVCTNTIKVDTKSPNLVIETNINDTTDAQYLVASANVTNNDSGYSYTWYKDDVLVSEANNYIITGTGSYKVRAISGSGIIEERDLQISTYTQDTVDDKVMLTVIGTMSNNGTCILKGKYANYTKEIPYDATTCTIDVANNLFKNGNLEYKSNLNVSLYNYNKPNNEITYTGSSIYITFDEYVPVDVNKEYIQTVEIKSDNPNAKHYVGFKQYDVDYKQIYASCVMFMDGSTTTLAQDLKNGDTVVYLEDVSGFVDTDKTYQLGFIFWNYKDSTGHLYPSETYSRNYSLDLYIYDNIDFENNTITLKKPWKGGTYVKGTSLSQSNSGGNDNYGLLLGKTLTNSYQTLTNTITGETGGQIQKYQNFRYGTKYIRFLIEHNYLGTEDVTTYIKSFTLKQND